MSAFLPRPPLPSTPPPPIPLRPPLCSRSAPFANALSKAATATLVAATLTTIFTTNPIPTPSAGYLRLPPIDRSKPNRCLPSSSSIGQANAARDTILDLRECDLHGQNLASFDLSGAFFTSADLSGASLVEAQLSKSYAPYASFRDANFTNAVVDRVTFDGADLTNVIFANAVLSDSSFENAVLENVDFTDVYIGDFAQRNICKNPTTKGVNPVTGAPTRESLGCR